MRHLMRVPCGCGADAFIRFGGVSLGPHDLFTCTRCGSQISHRILLDADSLQRHRWSASAFRVRAADDVFESRAAGD